MLTLVLLCTLTWLTLIQAEHHNLEFVVEQWVVDFLRPTVTLAKAGKKGNNVKFRHSWTPGTNLSSSVFFFPSPTPNPLCYSRSQS